MLPTPHKFILEYQYFEKLEFPIQNTSGTQIQNAMRDVRMQT